jgi:hypothetical protein
MRFAKAQEKKMGRPEQVIKKREPQKSPISKIWISTSNPQRKERMRLCLGEENEG